MAAEAGPDQLWPVCHVHGGRYKGWPPEGELAEEPAVLPQCYSCRWYHLLVGRRGMDWGVCFNPKSPRAGLLSFEHMGCHEWQDDEAAMVGDG